MCAAAISALLITSRDAIIGPETTLLSSSSGDSSVFTAARLDGLRYLDTTAPAIEAAYAPVQRSVAAAGAASTTRQAAATIRAEVLPQLHNVLQRAEAVRPGTAQRAAIHQACLAALRDSITEYSLFAQAFETGNAHASAQAKAAQRAANAEWTTWQVGLLRLKLGAGIPVTP